MITQVVFLDKARECSTSTLEIKPHKKILLAEISFIVVNQLLWKFFKKKQEENYFIVAECIQISVSLCVAQHNKKH